jgi:hypothetical protein
MSSCNVGVYPAQPIYAPERLTSYVMIKLPSPVVVGPESSIRLRLGVGYDVVIVSGEASRPMDFFACGKAKYALYGSPSHGVLVRYLEAVRDDSLPGQKPPWRFMLVEAVIRNETSDSLAVSRIVYSARNAPIYYTGEGRVYGPKITMRLSSSFTARVSVEEPQDLPLAARPSPIHYAPRTTTLSLNVVSIRVQEYLMRFGF